MFKNTNENQKIPNFNNQFPVDVFPKLIQKIILETHKCLSFPIDFISCSIIMAISKAIGKKSKVFLDFDIPINMYMVIVANRGTNKSAPVKWALKPFDAIDQENYIESSNGEFDQHIVSDTTMEDLKERLVNQLNGILFYQDEIGGILENLNRYHCGNDIPFLLSAFNGSAIRVNRKMSKALFAPDCFLCIFGTTQPEVFQKIIGKSIKNGFLDRFLVVYKDQLLKPHKSKERLNREIESMWHECLKYFIEFNPKERYQLNKEAQEYYYDWHRKITDYCNDSGSDVITGIYTKLEIYMLKFSLILQLLDDYCNNMNSNIISLNSIKGAEKITEYFFNNAYKFHVKGKRVSVWEALNGDMKSFYELMPNSNFFTYQAKEIVKESERTEISERTIDRYLKNKELFENLGNGKWKKKLME